MVWIKVLVNRRKSVGVLTPSPGGACIEKLDYGQVTVVPALQSYSVLIKLEYL